MEQAEFSPLLPTSYELALGGVVLVTLVGVVAALWREARLGGNVAGWLVAFAITGPVALLVYGATQLRRPDTD